MATSLILFTIVIIITSIAQLTLTILGFFGIFGAVIGISFLIPLLIVNAILSAFLHYSCWNCLPVGYRKNNPLTASLLLLVPIFNLYWFFVTFPNLGKGFDQCLASNALDSGMKKESLGTFYACALLAEFITGWIPILSGLVSFAVLLSFLLFYIEVIKASSAISKMQGRLVAQPIHNLVGVATSNNASNFSKAAYVEQPGTPIQKLLRLAKHYNGELSVAQMTMEMNLQKEELNNLLAEAQRDGYVEIVNHSETGMIRYRFDVD